MSSKQQTKQRVDQLREEIAKLDYAYYVLDSPEVGDEQYDQLMLELKQLEAENPELIDASSPTQRITGQVLQQFEQITHLEPMLSLSNARNESELAAWIERIHSELQRQDADVEKLQFITEPKIDGLAISVLYVDGKLERAATRGDGQIGEDVTNNIKTVRAVPLKIVDAPPVIEVRGEIYMPSEGFQQLNQQRAAAGQPTFMNPRNSAAGSIRQLDSKLVAQRPLSVWFYGIGYREGIEFETHSEALAWLRDRGLRTSPNVELVETQAQILKRCEWWQQQRDSLDFEIDGVVIKVDSLKLQQTLGAVGREPRHSTAWKFPPRTAITTLKAVHWNVGRTGHIVPFAELEPVVIGGVTVKMATLHNAEDLARKDVRPGDEVIVFRAGDVIPQVLSPAPKALDRPQRGLSVTQPTHCPSCGTEIVKQDQDGVWSVCPNRLGCPGQQWQAINHFIQRGAMDIDGIGEKQAKQLLEAGLITTVADLYQLQTEQLKELDGFAQRSAEKLLEAIDESRKKPFEKVLYGLGLIGIGPVNSRNLAEWFGTVEALQQATPEQLAEVPGIGDILAKQINEEINQPHTVELIKRLEAAGIKFQQEQKESESTLLSGTIFVITGTLNGLSREQAAELIRAAGGKVSSAISSKTTHLLAGEKAGSKLAKAEKIGVEVIDQKRFEELLNG